MKKVSIKKNYIYNVIYQLLLLVLPLITVPYLARVLGAKNIGIYSYTYSIVSYFILFAVFGSSLYGQREIAYNQDNIKERSRIFFEIFIFRFVSTILALILFYFMFIHGNNYNLYYKLLTFELLASLFDISWFYKGMEHFKKIISRNTIIKIISIILIYIFIKDSSHLFILFLIYGISNLAGNLSLWIDLKKYLVKPVNVNFLKRLKPMLLLFIPTIAVQIYTVFDRTMIGAILNNMAEVGYYDQSEKIIKMLLTIVTALSAVMIPRISYVYAKKDTKQVNEYLSKSFDFVWFLAIPIMFGIIGVAKNFVPLFFGPGYDRIILFMQLFSPLIIAIGLNNVIGMQYLIPTKKENIFTISVICGAVFNFIFNLLLINLLGTFGAIISTIGAEFLILFVQYFYVKKEIKFYIIIRNSYKKIVSGLLMLLCVYFVGFIFENMFASLISQVVTGIIIYPLVLLILKDEFIIYIVSNLSNYIKKMFIK